MTTVLDAPLQFDFITLDGQRSPGIMKIASGGSRKMEIVDQQQPLMAGANTVQRSRKNAIITYAFQLWTPADLATRDAWIKMFDEGSKRIPPRVFQVTDLNTPWLRRALAEEWDPQKAEKPGGPWSWGFTLHEYNRARPFGGPAIPPDGQDETLNQNRQAIAALQLRLGDITPKQYSAAVAGAGK